MSDLFRRIRYFLRDNTINKAMRKRLNNRDFTIIASDCVGGVLSHELKQRFNSPTINLYFSADDYIKFIYNMDFYLNQKMVLCDEKTDMTYPIACLGDIKLNLVHYKDINEAQEKWDERKKRINTSNMYFIFSDRNGFTEENARRFEEFPSEHKVLFTKSKELAEKYKSCYYVKGYEDKKCVGNMLDFNPKLWLRRNYDQFDFITWLNE